VILNPSGQEVNAEFELDTPYKKLNLLAGKEIKIIKNAKKLSVEIPNQTYAIYKLKM